MKRSLLLLTIVALITACKDDSDPQKIQLIDLSIGSYTNPYNSIWVMATDASGNILDSKYWNGDEHLFLHGSISPTEKFNLIILLTDASGASTDHLIQAYDDVEPGRIWHFGKWFVTPLELQGNYSVTWNNVPSASADKIYGMQQGLLIGEANECADGTCADVYRQYETNASSFFTFVPGDEQPLFFETDTLRAGKFYDIDFEAAFKPFENNVTIRGKENSQFVKACVGSINDQVASLQLYYYPDHGKGSSVLQIGYKGAPRNISRTSKIIQKIASMYGML